MTTVPLALLATLLLSLALSGLIVFNCLIGNLAFAFACMSLVCVLAVVVGVMAGGMGESLDAQRSRHPLTRLDLSDDVLSGLREIPEGTITNATVPPLFDTIPAGIHVDEPVGDVVGGDTDERIDQAVPHMDEGDEDHDDAHADDGNDGDVDGSEGDVADEPADQTEADAGESDGAGDAEAETDTDAEADADAEAQSDADEELGTEEQEDAEATAAPEDGDTPAE